MDDPRALVGETYAAVTAAVDALSERDLLRPTRAHGWAVQDLLLHLLFDAQRALVTMATPASGEPTVDAATYWAPFKPDMDGADAHARTVRVQASAHRCRPRGTTPPPHSSPPAAASRPRRTGTPSASSPHDCRCWADRRGGPTATSRR